MTTTTEILVKLSSSLGVKSDYMAELYYESGLEFIAQHRKRMQSSMYFNAQFGKMKAIGALNISCDDMYKNMEVSKWFWSWWLFVIVDTDKLYKPKSISDLMVKIELLCELIPDEVLIKIIHEKQTNNGTTNIIGGNSRRKARETTTV